MSSVLWEKTPWWFRPRPRREGSAPGASRMQQQDAGLRELFDRVGPTAFSLASALTDNRVEAEEVVVSAFVATRHSSGMDATGERQAILASVVARCEQRVGSARLAGEGDDVWSCLRAEQCAALALVSIGRCSLDEAAAILGLDRRTVAELLRDALRTVKRTRDSIGS